MCGLVCAWSLLGAHADHCWRRWAGSDAREKKLFFFFIFLFSTKKCVSIDRQDMDPLVVPNRWTGHRSWAMQLTKWRSWIKSSCRHEEIIGVSNAIWSLKIIGNIYICNRYTLHLSRSAFSFVHLRFWFWIWYRFRKFNEFSVNFVRVLCQNLVFHPFSELCVFPKKFSVSF
jgi:hypothetical protein